MIKIIKSSSCVLITYLLVYIITIISAFIYTKVFNNNLNYYISRILPIILLIYYIVITIFLYKRKKYPNLKFKGYFSKIQLGVSLSVILNMFIFKIYSNNVTINTNVVAILSSSIIGPIHEEVLFRYTLYNNLKEYFDTSKSILITTLIFALIHLSKSKIIFAFVIGVIANAIYEKDKNILSPILIHISANGISLFLVEYNTVILVLSFINLFISIILINNNYKLIK